MLRSRAGYREHETRHPTFDLEKHYIWKSYDPKEEATLWAFKTALYPFCGFVFDAWLILSTPVMGPKDDIINIEKVLHSVRLECKTMGFYGIASQCEPLSLPIDVNFLSICQLARSAFDPPSGKVALVDQIMWRKESLFASLDPESKKNEEPGSVFAVLMPKKRTRIQGGQRINVDIKMRLGLGEGFIEDDYYYGPLFTELSRM